MGLVLEKSATAHGLGTPGSFVTHKRNLVTIGSEPGIGFAAVALVTCFGGHGPGTGECTGTGIPGWATTFWSRVGARPRSKPLVESMVRFTLSKGTNADENAELAGSLARSGPRPL